MNKFTLAIVVVLVTVAGGVALRQTRSVEITPGDLPDPDLTQMESQVSGKLTALRLAVEGSLQSAEAWGALGMNYDVHGLKQEAAVSYRKAATLDGGGFCWA